MESAAAAASAEGQVQECPTLRALNAYENLLSQGAEGRVFRVTFLQRAAVAKQRFTKRYRHPDLDAQLTKSRLQGEARALLKARKLGVATPVLYFVDTAASCLYMEFVAGMMVKERLFKGLDSDGLLRVATKIGRAVGRLHDGGVVHGDLTTSNMILRESDDELVLIDFGLSYNTSLPEDKAVDLYVLERAITSAHSTFTGLFEAILEEYRRCSKQWSATLHKFAEVRMRGRKRSMVG